MNWHKHANSKGIVSVHAFRPTGSLCRKVSSPNGAAVAIADFRGIACPACVREARKVKA